MLGVTGSIAAYKAVEILRRLREAGASVRVVMTRNAAQFVAPLTFETLSEAPILIDEFMEGGNAGIGHIRIAEGIDAAVIAPATANIIGKIASGIADDALTTAVLALDCPLIMAPAMNDRMYRNPVVRRNIGLLMETGTRFIEPDTGKLACGATGPGRLASTEKILGAVAAALAPKDLAGVPVLVTAGPTQEAIDAVRFISNSSTGKMGYAMAAAARDRGADVVLISGPTHLPKPGGVKLISVVSAAEMRRAVMENFGASRVVIMAAAVSDFRPVKLSDGKVRKDSVPETIKLEQTEDILRDLGAKKGDRLLIGFAAETDNITRNAGKKLKDKNLDLIVANNVLEDGAGFAWDTNAVTLMDSSGVVLELPMMPKTEIAARIMEKVAGLAVNKGVLP